MNRMVSIFKALSDQNRLKVMAALTRHSELCACQITELLQVSGATTSRHLDILINADLIDRRKDGRWVYYRLKTDNEDFVPVMNWIKNEFSKSDDIKNCLDNLKEITACGLKVFCANKSKKEKLKVLFLCTGNSCRSQMAEGWTRHLKSDLIEAYSAGIETHGLNPNAVKVMAEAGVDISRQKSQHIDEFKDVKLDIVVTVCGHAHKSCPFFPSNCKVIHVGFGDPPKMAKDLAEQGGNEEAQLDCYRKVRNEIKDFVETMPKSLDKDQKNG